MAYTPSLPSPSLQSFLLQPGLSVWPAWGCLSLFSCPLSLLRPVKLRSAQPSAPGEDALHLRDEVITGGKTRGCWSPGFQLPWKHVRPMEGWELSAVEGGGGTRERVEERHISWRVRLTAPRFPQGCALQLAGPGRPPLDWGRGWVRAGWRAQSTATCLYTPGPGRRSERLLRM